MNNYNDTSNIIKFQQDVLEDQADAIRAYIAALAQTNGNDKLASLFAHYGFRTFYTPELFDGWRVGLARDLAKLCYGKEDISAVLRLCQRYDIGMLRLKASSVPHVQRMQVLEAFVLPTKTSQVNLITWKHVLVAGAKGETPFARKMWAYIHGMLERAEADEASRLQTGRGLQENIAEQLQRPSPIDAYPELKAIVELVESVAAARKVAEAAQDEAAQATAKANLALQQQQWLTIREYVYLHKLMHQFPEQLWSAFGRYLTGYCLEHNIPIRRQAIAGKGYEMEQAYHVEVLAQLLAPWLTRHRGQASLYHITGGLS